jgi:hypothetical protein
LRAAARVMYISPHEFRITENQTNTVKRHIARARAAPHTNADGRNAIERFATPH